MFKYTLPALLLVSMSGVAYAQSFEEIDVDGDGMITAAEAEAAGIDIGAADESGDGVLSREEYDAHMGAGDTGEATD